MQQWLEKYPQRAIWGLLIFYYLLRLPSFSVDPLSTPAFSHDSAYLLIVARNLMDGLGFVNQTSWLLFLNPDRLPMPFHNANPLFPVLVATLSSLGKLNLGYAALCVALAGHVVLLAAGFTLVRWGTGNTQKALVFTALLAVLPPFWQESLHMGVDALATGFMVAMFACALPAKDWRGWLCAGLFLSLSWLTRSTILLVMPGFALFVWWRDGWRKAFEQLTLMGVVALVVASPWLWHTAKVWGNPLRSDASYYLFQDYFALLAGSNVEQFWRSVTPPPTVGAAISQDPTAFLSHWIRGIFTVCYNWLSQWNQGSKPAAALFVISLGCGLYAARSWWRSALLWMCALGGLLTVLSLGLRAGSFELRYFAPVNVMVGLILAAPLLLAGSGRGKQLALCAPLLAYLTLFVARQDYSTLQLMRSPGSSLASIRQTSQQLARQLPPDATVVCAYPYYFGFFSRLRTVSPPYPGTPELLAIMKKYGAHYLLLPMENMSYYYAGAPASLETWFKPLEGTNHHQLFELKAR